MTGNLLSQSTAMEAHITTEATHFKGECYAWDVVNEPFNSDGSFVADPFYNAMGSSYIADALKTAHAADPNAKLYLNDYGIKGENAKSNAMYSLAQSLLAQGVPLNGIGFEQATDFATVVRDCPGVSRCVGVTQWAVGDADSWVRGTFPGQGAATMFDQNYSPKPAFTAVQSTLAAAGGSGSDTVTVTNPGTQTGTVGTAASLQIQAVDSASGQTLSYSATGLPAGLVINASSGLIADTPTASGNSTVTVNVSEALDPLAPEVPIQFAGAGAWEALVLACALAESSAGCRSCCTASATRPRSLSTGPVLLPRPRPPPSQGQPRQFTEAREEWLPIIHLPAYASDLNAVESAALANRPWPFNLCKSTQPPRVPGRSGPGNRPGKGPFSMAR